MNHPAICRAVLFVHINTSQNKLPLGIRVNLSMSLLKEIVQQTRQQDLIDESAAGGATAAGSVAGFRGHFFAPTDKKKKKKKRKMLRRNFPVGSIFGLRTEGIEDQKFDAADVISKLKTAEQKAHNEDETTGFALEDEEGRIVKVFVAAEEAKDFETALGAALAGEKDDADIDGEENSSLEIAEVLFNLKDRFTIVDVEWPQVEEDEEEQEVEGLGDAEGDLDIDLQGEGKGEGEGEGEGEDEDEAGMEAALQGEEGGEFGGDMGAEDDAKSALDSVIDLLVSQADAQKAEANAEEAKYNAQEAKYNSKAANAKVKQEEEVLDMEAHYDKQGKIEKEAKQLAKLAKWKHETAQGARNSAKGESAKFKMPEEDNEEYENLFTRPLPGDEIPGNKFEKPGDDENRDHRLQPGEFIKYMLRSAQGN